MPNSCEALLATKEHVAFCFDTLCGHFRGDIPAAKLAEVVCPLFVTWNKVDNKGHARLRGCIGTLEPRSLPKALKEYSLTRYLSYKATSPQYIRHNTQFSKHYTAERKCTVSFLHSFEPEVEWSDWTIGVHGLIIKFRDPASGTRRSATFLPEVAAHEGWSQLQTMASLIRKAGYSGEPKAVLKHLQVTRYQSSACSMTYSEFFALRHQSERECLPDHNIAITVPA